MQERQCWSCVIQAWSCEIQIDPYVNLNLQRVKIVMGIKRKNALN